MEYYIIDLKFPGFNQDYALAFVMKVTNQANACVLSI